MPIDLKKQKLKLKDCVLREIETLWIENDVLLSDTKPDIFKILYVNAKPYLSKMEVIDGKVKVEGKITYNIIYKSTSSSMANRGIIVTYPFSTNIINDNIKEGMIARGKVRVKNIIHSIPNERKINLKSELVLNVNIFDIKCIDVLQGIRNEVIDDNIEVILRKENILNLVDCIEDSVSGKDDVVIPIDKPNIYEIVSINANIINFDYKISYNKILVKGDIQADISYIGDNEKNTLESYNVIIPFAGFIEAVNIKENSICDISYNISNLNIRNNESEDKSNIITCEYDIDVCIDICDDNDIEYIEDFYGLKSNYSYNKKERNIVKKINNIKKDISINEIINIKSESGNNIIATNCNTNNIDIKYANNTITLDGILKCNILMYDETKQEIDNKEYEIMVNKNIDIDNIINSDNIDLEINVKDISAQIENGELKIKANIEVDIKMNEYITIASIEDIKEVEDVDKIDNMNIYIVNKDDTMWSIAKKYKTTIDKIAKINNIEDTKKISVGQKLLILR